MSRRFRILGWLAFIVAAAASSAEILDNAAVIRLAKAGLSAEIIVLKIDQSEGRFDVSTDALVELKGAGIPDSVIKAMMLKAPRPASNAVASPAPTPRTGADICTKVSFYTLGTDGWAWVPATACVSATRLSIDEQSFDPAALTVQCIEPEARFAILGANSSGEATWRFSDGKEAFEMRGKPDEIHALADRLASAAPAVPHGKCSAGELRALLKMAAR
jgi:hypothetical protein